MQRVKIRRSMSLYPSGMRRQASVIRFPTRGALGQNRRLCEEQTAAWYGRIDRRCPVKVHRLVAIAILTLLPAFAVAADEPPPAQSPESGGEQAPDITPEKPSESGVPAIPPSRMDPGIQHQPESREDPRGSVKPPNLDPSMSTNPDVAPSPREGINPPGGAKPQGKPGAQE
jgi:hypothetical protein